MEQSCHPSSTDAWDTLDVRHASASGPKPNTKAVKQPPGYSVVGADFDAPSGVLSTGAVECPAGTVVWGGGSFTNGANTFLADVNSSVPYGSGAWVASINNTSGADLSFDVQAICADQPAKYVISATTDNPAGTQNYVQVTCPKGTVVLGGGAYSDSTDPADNMNSSFPSVSKKKVGSWFGNMNNGSGSDASVTSSAICARKPKGYKQYFTTVQNPAGQQTAASTTCQAGMPISGGPISEGGGLSVNMGASLAYGNLWAVDENNASPSPFALAVYVLCAE